MTNKVQVIQKDTFDVIKSAVDKTVDLIKPTFGPASNKVIISKLTHGFVLDDGVQIARDLELENPAENAVLKVIRETAIKTNDRVGDGTTGALILLQAIISEVSKSNNFNGRAIEQDLKKGAEECKKQIEEMSEPVETREDLFKVAMISFDDEKIAKLIADAWYDLGKDGVLTVDKSQTMETYVDLADGIDIKSGYLSPYMITNAQRMESLIEKPYILITDYRLTEVKDVLEIMNKLLEQKITSLVIIADNVEQSALATLVVNKMQGKFNSVAIATPRGKNSVNLEDIALMTGAKLFSEKKGDKLESATIEDLGRADRFICREKESIIVGPRGDKEKTESAINDLTTAAQNEPDETKRKEIESRVARFKNKIGVIKVGAATENEANALKYKVEDAVNATQSAFKGGVVAGGGVTLTRLKTSSKTLNEALKVPFRQLLDNTGIKLDHELQDNEAYNAVTMKSGNWKEVGVMDPANVLKAQIQSAVSIAGLLVTTKGMIVERPKHLKEE